METNEIVGPISVHVFMRGLVFPVAAYAYDEREQMMLRCMESNYRHLDNTTESVCLWCAAHDVSYRVITELTKWTPGKAVLYLRIKHHLKF